MEYVQYLEFELTPACNLGGIHTQCPNRKMERFDHLDASRPMTDDQIVNVTVEAFTQHGFTGDLCFFRYNEPFMAEDRMWRVMDSIDACLPGTRYQLWTNGTIKPKKPENLKRFCRTILTDYHLTNHPVDGTFWRKHCANLCHQNGHLDGRVTVTTKKSDAPCWMMHKEMSFDYYGNLHICCYDWMGLASPGNIHTTPFAELVARFQAIRSTMNGERMTDDAPDVCKTCRMREAGIPRFVPAVWERSYKMLTRKTNDAIRTVTE